MPLDTLVALAVGDLDADAAALDAAEGHVLGCDACAGLFERLCAIGDGVRALVAAGGARFAVSPVLGETMARAGLITRRYRTPCDGGVQCTVDAGDVYVESTLEADLTGVTRVDLVAPDGQRLEDVPFDPARGEVRFVVGADVLRPMPTMTLVYTLLAVDDDGDRALGTFSFHHTAMGRGAGAD